MRLAVFISTLMLACASVPAADDLLSVGPWTKSANGRGHSPAGYSVWFAGGGVKGGQIIGQTDPIGYVTVERPVSPHDFHATILHALGLDASHLSYRHHGRDEVPTVFGGEAVREVFT